MFGLPDPGAWLPPSLVPPFALLTQLGDAWLLLLVSASYYWYRGSESDARAGGPAFVFALALGVLALTLALKSFFAVPRPPGADSPIGIAFVPPALRDVYTWAATADGYGFPSGHAVGATAVWSALALVSDYSTRRRRLAVAGALVAVVGLSRIVLGVHYPVDVLVGVVVGLGSLLFAWRFARDPGRTFGLAFLAAALAVLIGGVAPDTAAAVGATLAGTLAWYAVVARAESTGTRPRLTLAVGLAFVAAVAGTTYAFRPPVPVVVLASAVTVAGTLSLPLVVGRIAGTGEEGGSCAQKVSR